MGALQTVENKLNEVFKGLPPLSEKAKESLVKAWPWIALIFGVLQLLAAWALWGLTNVAERLTDYANTLSTYYTGQSLGLSAADKTIIYLGLAVLVVDAVILLMAFPQLQKRTRRGWDLLFLGSLLNLVYAVVTLFIDARGAGSFIFNLLGSAIGFYLLFQVREKYKGHKATSVPPNSASHRA